MEEFDDNQQDAIKRKRQELLNKMGVKNAGRMMNESIVATNGANSGMAAKLAAIRSGNAKQELSKYINATGKNAPSAPGEFQGIPEVKKRKNPGQPTQEVDPKYKQSVADFGAAPVANGGELSAIESMFGGGESRSVAPMGGNSSQAPARQADLSLDNISLPTFNPNDAIRRAKEKSRAPEAQEASPYMKFASNVPQIQNEEFVETGAQPNINLAMMQNMMETIAKGVAEKTIKSVLSEYSQQQKNKVYFEYYNKEKGIIKTADGKFYKLTQVELKKKA